MGKGIHLRRNFRLIMRVSLLQIMLLTGLLCIAYAGSVTGQEILDTKITIDLQRGSLRDALVKIEKIAEVKFLFHTQLVSAHNRVTIVANQERLVDVLDKILTTRKISFEADGNQIILSKADPTQSSQDLLLQNTINDEPNFLITGRIVDDRGDAIPGVNILIKGTTTGTTTDLNGKFSIEVPDDNSMLIISYIGYLTEEILVGKQTEINLALTSDITTLGEVMVVGYGTQKKSDVISSISSVKGSDLNLQSMPNFEAGLQGLASGVSVQSQSGAPGAPVRILIRGTNSINLTTEPLYIIDGMPINMGNDGVGSSNLSPMSLINQNDIESIEILKDAAALSIYGSRGSNGVIIVTTKSGKRGEGSTTLNYITGFSTLTRSPADVGYANTNEWFAIMDEAYGNAGSSFTMSEYYDRVPLTSLGLASSQLTREQAEGINTNWQKELFQVGTFQSYNVSSTRGTEKTAFFISGNYRKDNGVQRNNDLERFTLRSNLDFNPTQNLTISSKITFGYTKNNQRESGITSIGVGALPWLPVYDLEDPNLYYNPFLESNAVARSDPNNVLNKTEQYRALGGITLNYTLPNVNGLTLRSEFSGDIVQSTTTNWLSDRIRLQPSLNTPQARATQESVTFNSLNYNAYATYDKIFGEHALLMVGGAEATRSSQNLLSVVGTGLTGRFQDVGSPEISSVLGRKENERYLLGYFGRVNYKFRDRYLFGLSARRDGSSVFTAENRWGTFLAASAGWIISDESFMSFLGGNTFLKIRGSFGETGNQNLPIGLEATGYNNAPEPILYGSRDILGVNGTIVTNIGVRDLKWETTRSSDIGLDFGFFKNRLNGSIAYYNRYISDQLLPAPIPPSTGLSTQFIYQRTFEDVSSNIIWGNFGNMVNSGYELELHSINIDKKGFKWTTSFNIGFNKNEIRSLAPDIDITGSGLLNIFGNAISKKGERRNVWYVAEYAGVDPLTGIPMIYARDNERFLETGETDFLTNNVGERIKLPANVTNIAANPFYQEGKSGDPKYQGGITNTVQYNNFDLSIMISFSGGNYILDHDLQQASVVNPTRTILREVYEQSWRNVGDNAKYPRLRAGVIEDGFSGVNAYHTGELHKGDFVRLRNVQLGYKLADDITYRIRLQAVRFFISGSNLLTITNYPGFDPEGAGNPQVPGFINYATAIPQLKTFTFGIDARF